MQCPKCRYERQPHDDHVMAGVCPSCGIAYGKWLERQAVERDAAVEPMGEALTNEAPEDTVRADEPLPDELLVNDEFPLRARLIRYLLFVPSDRHESAFWGHALLWVFFLLWGWAFILGGIDWRAINASFLHNVNLAFHEFGHLAFSPFGRFMAILGGSLFQVLLPFGLLLVFSIRQRDNFAASLMLWWCGQNLIDVSPYIADAPARVMPLIGGLGEEAHDWGNLLRMTGTLEAAPTIAWTAFTLGAALIVLSQLWGAALLYIELRGRRVIGDGPV